MIGKLCRLISSQCYIFITPENVRKPLVKTSGSVTFSGCIEDWLEMT